MGEDLEQLKQRLPLLDYLRQQNWIGRPSGQGPEFVGLCPLHPETRPSFYVNARKNLFYCHGCGQGGDLIRLVELSQHLSFRQSLTYLEQQCAVADPAAVLRQACAFYQQQLDRYPEALRYLEQRGLRDPALIRELQVGYAPGGSLRRHLDTSSPTWLSRNALQFCAGGFVLLGIHRETVRSEMLIPSFRSSPCTRGAPHNSLTGLLHGAKAVETFRIELRLVVRKLLERSLKEPEIG